jgi:hypothetical protein
MVSRQPHANVAVLVLHRSHVGREAFVATQRWPVRPEVEGRSGLPLGMLGVTPAWAGCRGHACSLRQLLRLGKYAIRSGAGRGVVRWTASGQRVCIMSPADQQLPTLERGIDAGQRPLPLMVNGCHPCGPSRRPGRPPGSASSWTAHKQAEHVRSAPGRYQRRLRECRRGAVVVSGPKAGRRWRGGSCRTCLWTVLVPGAVPLPRPSPGSLREGSSPGLQNRGRFPDPCRSCSASPIPNRCPYTPTDQTDP